MCQCGVCHWINKLSSIYLSLYVFAPLLSKLVAASATNRYSGHLVWYDFLMTFSSSNSNWHGFVYTQFPRYNNLLGRISHPYSYIYHPIPPPLRITLGFLKHCSAVRELEWWWCTRSLKDDSCSHFGTITNRDRQTDRQTDILRYHYPHCA